MGKLGRERVCCLVSDDVEFPSDIQGVVYTSAKNVGQWKYDLAKELKAAGFDIDMNKLWNIVSKSVPIFSDDL